MNVELKDIVGLLAAVIAAASLASNLAHQRASATKKMLEEAEERMTKFQERARADLELRIAAAVARAVEADAKIAQLRLDFVQHQGHVITRSEMGDILENALQPLLRHVAKSESFMEELLRTGLLTNHRGERK